jgi:hypothetical protein
MMTQTRSSPRQHVKLILAGLASVGSVSSASATGAAYWCADGTAVHALFSCVYRKPKPGRSGDGARRGWRVN